MTIRLATPNDIEAYIRARFDYFAAEGWKVTDEMRQELHLRLCCYYKAHINEDFYVSFAEIEGKIVSVAFLTISEMPANVFAPSGKYGTILNVLTYPGHRRMGYSTKALELLIKKAKEKDLSFLQISASDMGRTVYERLGFRPAEYYGFTHMRLPLV